MDVTRQQQRALIEQAARLDAGRDVQGGTPPGSGAEIKDILAKASIGNALTEEDTSRLEQIILNDFRPIVPIIDGHIAIEQVMPTQTGADAALRDAATQTGAGVALRDAAELIELQAASVGRVMVDGVPSISWRGSCFLVATNVVATTRHIAESIAEIDSAGRWHFRRGMSAAIDFDNPTRGQRLAVTEVALVHPVLDLALLRIVTDPHTTRQPLILDGSTQALEPGRLAAIVGFGVYDKSSRVLLSRADNKLVSTGLVLGLKHYMLGGTPHLSVAHDCSTVVGMSGAPLIDIATGSVIGMHFARSDTLDNFAVPASEMVRERRLRPFGLTFSGSADVDDLAWVEAWSQVEPHTEAAAPETDFAEAAPEQARQPSIDQIDEALKLQCGTVDELVEFLKGYGPEYEQAVASQPGRERSDEDVYRRALTTTIKRRGLIDQRFLQAIGLAEKASATPAAEASVTIAEVDKICERLELHKTRGAALRAMLLGSPYWDQLTDGGKPRSLKLSLEKLAGSPEPGARDALVWLLNRILMLAGGDTEDAKIGRAEVMQLIERLGGAIQGQGQTDSYVPGPQDMLDLSYFQAGIAAARSVGMIRWTGSGARAGGSCWLLTPELVVAAAHVLDIGNDDDPDSGSVSPSAQSVPDDRLNDLEASFDDEKFTLKQIAFIDRGLDVAVMRMDRASGLPPLRIRTTPIAEGGLTSIHHPGLMTKKVSALGGRLLSNDGHECVYLLATAPGSGGAPVFDRDWKVVATHRASLPYTIAPGQPKIRAKVGTTTPALVDAIRTVPNGERVWREIVGSQRDLRSIDASLIGLTQSTEERPQRSVVIEMVDGSTPAPEIAGLTVTQRSGRIITALADVEAIRTLAETVGVVALEASGAAGSTECMHSMPAIGIHRIQEKHGEQGDSAIIGIIDNGIDVEHAAFLGNDGKTRIVAFWDQQDPRSGADQPTTTMSDEAAKCVAKTKMRGGALYLKADIQSLLDGTAVRPNDFPAGKLMMHGTAVASIAAGRRTGKNPGDFPGGAAPQAQIIVVRYDLDGESVGSSAGHIQALNFIDHLAGELDLPVVINISNGTNSGAHDGSATVEVACDVFTHHGQKAGRVIVKSAGNECNMARHARLQARSIPKKLRWQSAPSPDATTQRSLAERIELWFPRADQYSFQVEIPRKGGRCSPISLQFQELPRERLANGNDIKAQYWPIRKENGQAMLEIVIEKGDAAIVESGIWTLIITPVKVTTDKPINAWMEQLSNRANFFLDGPVDDCTITVPGTSEHVITVGAIEASEPPFSYDKSSMGPTAKGVDKPELSAPGVDICTALAGSTSARTPVGSKGTSLATPHVTGVIALALSARKKSGKLMLPGTIIKGLLLNTLKNFQANADPQTGHGLLDGDAFFDQVEAEP